ncbi:hypothetical protein EYF80_014234 [Liparis tanakae]|uniref:Uncharacterized protein n=1 Tax=Liparis tanakae TaxID=230148 RepID=A0A4Z2IDN9_9TELE|nr:hypothetical protein EYF80_014234 [Liparis tanakae]
MPNVDERLEDNGFMGPEAHRPDSDTYVGFTQQGGGLAGSDAQNGLRRASGQSFVPSTTHRIPQSYGGYAIRRLRDPADQKDVNVGQPPLHRAIVASRRPSSLRKQAYVTLRHQSLLQKRPYRRPFVQQAYMAPQLSSASYKQPVQSVNPEAKWRRAMLGLGQGNVASKFPTCRAFLLRLKRKLQITDLKALRENDAAETKDATIQEKRRPVDARRMERNLTFHLDMDWILHNC